MSERAITRDERTVLELALATLERHRAELDVAIAALRRLEITGPSADAAAAVALREREEEPRE